MDSRRQYPAHVSKGALTSPGRSVPWLSEDFDCGIAGGLEPGEEKTVKLAPNRHGDWGNAPKDRSDLILTVEVLQDDGAANKKLFDSQLSNRDRERLDELKAALLQGDY